MAEIGDKTQLLAFILAARFKRPLPIIMAIFLATLINHGLAGAIGIWITTLVNPNVLRWVLGFSFFAMAVWTLIPDNCNDTSVPKGQNSGVFGATFITFFLAEMGDKTQLATIALTAHYGNPLIIISSTTIGMLLADIPAVLLGNTCSQKIPMNIVHVIAAVIFIIIGLFTLIL